MTTKPKTTEVTAPAIPADIAFGNAITSLRDAADAEQGRLHNERNGREAFFDREIARMVAEWDAERASLDSQIAAQAAVLDGCDAALESLAPKQSNIVAMAAE